MITQSSCYVFNTLILEIMKYTSDVDAKREIRRKEKSNGSLVPMYMRAHIHIISITSGVFLSSISLA